MRAGVEELQDMTGPWALGGEPVSPDVSVEQRISLSTALEGGPVDIEVVRTQVLEGKTVGEKTVETLKVNIPAGIEDGQTMRIRGLGNQTSASTPPGNLLIVVRIDEDPRFLREGADLTVAVRVAAQLAQDGGLIDVPLPSGQTRVRLAPGTKNGSVLTIPGFGGTRFGSPVVPLPSTPSIPYRSADANTHRGALKVVVEVAGSARHRSGVNRGLLIAAIGTLTLFVLFLAYYFF